MAAKTTHAPTGVVTSATPVFESPVHTNLNELVHLQTLASLVMSKKRRTAARQQGTAPSKQFGRGLDFAEVREYHAGDEVRMMDWNVTARTGRAHIKLFMEERERPVLFLVDQTSSMRFGTKGMFKSAMAARLSALLAWCALSDGDRIGGAVAYPSAATRFKPAGQRRGIMRLLQTLTLASEKDDVADHEINCASMLKALQHIKSMAPSGSRLVFVSDFQTIDARIEQEISVLLRRVEVTPICIQDALESQLPARGVLPVLSKRGGAPALALNTGPSAQKAHARKAVENLERINQIFLTGGQAVTHVKSHEPLVDAAMRAWFGVTLNPTDASTTSSQSHG